MVYTSLSSKDGNYPYQLNIAHLYGNLMNTYGDNGNILMLKYVAEKLGAHVTVDIVSLHDDFDENHYDITFFGGGQDFEQSIIADDLPAKKESIDNYIQNDGVVLAICGGFQLLGQYYVEASGKRIEGLGVMVHTLPKSVCSYWWNHAKSPAYCYKPLHPKTIRRRRQFLGSLHVFPPHR